MQISITCEGDRTDRLLDFTDLNKSITEFYAEVAYYTSNTTGTVWQLLKHFAFSDLLLCKLYTEFGGFNNSANFFWDISRVNETKTLAKDVIAAFLDNPPDYNEHAIAEVAKTFTNSHRLGYVMHSQMGGVYVDLVHRVGNLFLPVIVFPDKYGAKDDTLQKFEKTTGDRLLTKPTWVARLDSVGVIYNKRHFTYIRILLAMAVLNVRIGTVVLYNSNNGHTKRYQVDMSDDDLLQIRLIEAYYYPKFTEVVMASKHCIPRIEKPHKDDEDMLLPWNSLPYEQLGKYRTVHPWQELI